MEKTYFDWQKTAFRCTWRRILHGSELWYWSEVAVQEVGERLAVTKLAIHKLHLDWHCLNKLNEAESIERYQVKSQTASQLWKTLTIEWILIDIVKMLVRTYKFQSNGDWNDHESKQRKL
jgi:hypothetical protein